MNMGGESKIEEPKVVVGEETKVGVSRNFSQSWLSIFPWLSFETEKQMMFCTVCLKDGVAKNLFTRGCNNLYCSHCMSITHRLCVCTQSVVCTQSEMCTLYLVRSVYMSITHRLCVCVYQGWGNVNNLVTKSHGFYALFAFLGSTFPTKRLPVGH